MGLFDSLKKYDEPGQRQNHEFICTIKTTRSGRQIMLCSVEPPPKGAVDQATKAGFPLFVASEIARMVDLDPKTVDSILVAKTAAPGCNIDEIIRCGAIK